MHIGLQVAVGVSIIVAAAFIVWLCTVTQRKVSGFFKRVNKAFIDIEQMRQGGEARREESKLFFKGLLTVFDVLGGKEMNGNVKELEEAYQKHFIENV